jgi:hypothetical protein
MANNPYAPFDSYEAALAAAEQYGPTYQHYAPGGDLAGGGGGGSRDAIVQALMMQPQAMPQQAQSFGFNPGFAPQQQAPLPAWYSGGRGKFNRFMQDFGEGGFGGGVSGPGFGDQQGPSGVSGPGFGDQGGRGGGQPGAPGIDLSTATAGGRDPGLSQQELNAIIAAERDSPLAAPTIPVDRESLDPPPAAPPSMAPGQNLIDLISDAPSPFGIGNSWGGQMQGFTPSNQNMLDFAPSPYSGFGGKGDLLGPSGPRGDLVDPYSAYASAQEFGFGPGYGGSVFDAGYGPGGYGDPSGSVSAAALAAEEAAAFGDYGDAPEGSGPDGPDGGGPGGGAGGPDDSGDDDDF